MKIYVATVVSTDFPKTGLSSKRPSGDWASFTGDSVEKAVDLARAACLFWRQKDPTATYKILVGELTGVVGYLPYVVVPFDPEEQWKVLGNSAFADLRYDGPVRDLWDKLS